MRIASLLLCCVFFGATVSRRASAQASVPVESSLRKEQASQFDVGAFNDLMMRAVDNSSNNVKRSAPPGSYQVFGRVVDHGGDPVAGAQVMLGSKGGRDLYWANFDLTDEQGRFVVRSDHSSKSVFVRHADRFFQQAIGGKVDVTVSIPTFYPVSLKLEQTDQLFETVFANPTPNESGSQVQPLAGTRVKIKDALAGRLRLVPGEYAVTGSRRLITKDGHEDWGAVYLGDILVKAEDGQTFSLRQGGVTVNGSFTKLPKVESLSGIKASLFRGANGRSGTFDVVLCDEQAGFRFDAVAPGSYVLEVRTIPKLPKGQRNNGLAYRGFRPANAAPSVVLYRKTIEVSDRPLQLNLKPQSEEQKSATTTAQQIRAILQSEHPQPNVSWSWTDVQVAQIVRLTDRTGAQNELLRLITAEDTPGDWRYLALRALPSMTPLPEDVVPRLAEALHKPAIGRYRGSVLGAIRKMSDGVEAVPIILPLKDDEDWRLRYSVADALGEIANRLIEPPDAIVAALIGFLEDRHGVVRKEAAGALGVLRDPGASEALKRRLNDAWGPARAMIAWALFECSNEAEPAVTAMVDLLENGDGEGRKEAAYYLQMFDHRAEGALPVLRRFLSYQGKPPFNQSNDLLKYQLRRNAERSIAAIEASVIWRDSEPRFELGVAPIDPKQQLNGTIKWGAAVDGVQLGLAIESPTNDFIVGERLPIVLLIRNLSTATVRLEMDRRLPDAAPETTLASKRQYVMNTRLLLSPESFVFDVPPGETYWIAHNGLGLGEGKKTQGLWFPFLNAPDPASYAVCQRHWFELYDNERRTKKQIWLTTGRVTFNVVGQ